MKRVSSVMYNPTVKKTTFTFGHGPGRRFVAPGVQPAPPIEVSSVAFLPHKEQKKTQTDDHLPTSDLPVQIDGKLVLKVRQFPGADSSNWTSCFPPGALEDMRAPNNKELTVTFNPPIVAKESEDKQSPPDVVAQVVQPTDVIGPLSDDAESSDD